MNETIRIHCKEIDMRGDTPFLSHARKLIKAGVSPDTRVEFFDENYDPRIILNHLGTAATLGVNGSNNFYKISGMSEK